MWNKQQSLAALARNLAEQIKKRGVDEWTCRALIQYTEASANQLRLAMSGGWTWETARVEWSLYRVAHPEALLSHRMFKSLTLLAALVVPPRFFYRVQRMLAQSGWYRRVRKRLLPAPEMLHIQKTSEGARESRSASFDESVDRRWIVSLGKQYDEWHQRVSSDPGHADERSPWYKLVLEHIGSVDGLRILEVACGRGGFASLLASRGAIMFGADFSQTALQIAQAKRNGVPHAHLNLTQADAENLPFSAESFDVIVSCETIEHLPNPASALKEMARVCRVSGMLYLTTPNYLNAMGLYYIYARLRGRQVTPGADQPFDRAFVFPKVRSLLKHAGWKIIKTDGTVHQFPIRPGHNPLTVAALEANRTTRRFLSPLAFHYFALARKSDSS